jgi:lipopolysaccharide export system ATP-binding protein
LAGPDPETAPNSTQTDAPIAPISSGPAVTPPKSEASHAGDVPTMMPVSNIMSVSPVAAVKPLAPQPDSPFGDTSGPELYTPSLGTSIIPMTSQARMRRVMDAVPEKPPEPVLQAKGLKKRFGRREVVCGVDLDVGAGEIVGLLGRNGAGKTTTFRMIMGLLHPDAGSVSYLNRDISRMPMYERANHGIGYLSQQPSVFQRLSVEDNLLAVLELQEPSREQRMKRIEQLIEELGLGTVRKSMAAVLSGGERRRLEIARAMSLKPKIVLFDEPFAGIDPIAVNEIQGILRGLRSNGVGVLITDHNVRETLMITDRTYIMDEGKIWIHGTPREIVQNPDAKARYLGHDFRLDF